MREGERRLVGILTIPSEPRTLGLCGMADGCGDA